MLSLFITGAYPGAVSKALLGKKAFGSRALRRYLAREEPGIPPELVRAKTISEILVQCAAFCRRVSDDSNSRFAESLEMLGLLAYARSAARDVRSTPARIYHYRAGNGLKSAETAKARGLVTLCDHSLANPEVLEYLVANGGQWPKTLPKITSRLLLASLHDIRLADYMLVNSDFVRDSFVRFDWPPERIFVQYTGVDDEFLRAVTTRGPPNAIKRPSLLFAGALSRRKGAEVLIAALRLLDGVDFHLEIIGDVESGVRGMEDLKLDKRVTRRGNVPRDELARRMGSADIFVFPSLAEGSARVVFMALAAGCFVITTPNAGSVVKTGENGLLVEAGSAEALAGAIRTAVKDVAHVQAVGRRNAALIRERYTQKHYGDGVATLYGVLLEKHGRKMNHRRG